MPIVQNFPSDVYMWVLPIPARNSSQCRNVQLEKPVPSADPHLKVYLGFLRGAGGEWGRNVYTKRFSAQHQPAKANTPSLGFNQSLGLQYTENLRRTLENGLNVSVAFSELACR